MSGVVSGVASIGVAAAVSIVVLAMAWRLLLGLVAQVVFVASKAAKRGRE